MVKYDKNGFALADDGRPFVCHVSGEMYPIRGAWEEQRVKRVVYTVGSLRFSITHDPQKDCYVLCPFADRLPVKHYKTFNRAYNGLLAIRKRLFKGVA